jgi:hypothetical protein
VTQGIGKVVDSVKNVFKSLTSMAKSFVQRIKEVFIPPQEKEKDIQPMGYETLKKEMKIIAV